jgi:hypothetical protein
VIARVAVAARDGPIRRPCVKRLKYAMPPGHRFKGSIVVTYDAYATDATDDPDDPQ